MYTIYVAIFFGVLLALVSKSLGVSKMNALRVFGFIVFLGVLAGLFIPFSGFEETRSIEKAEIVPYDDSEYLSDNGVFKKYRHKEAWSLLDEDGISYSKEYYEKRVFYKDIIIILERDIEVPYVEICEARGIKSNLTFAFFARKRIYKFHIPRYLNY